MIRPSLTAAVLLLFFTAGAHGTITVIDYYRLGEHDPGATALDTGKDTTRDSSGNLLGANDLIGHVVGEFEFERLRPANYHDTVGGAATKLGSTLAMNFDTISNNGVPYDSSQPSTLASVNFGLEGWFRPEGVNFNQGLVYNGNQLSRGFGLFIHDGKYQAHLGGVGFIDTGVAAIADAWTYFAIVFEAGVTKLYLNSTTPVVTSAVPPIPAAPGDAFVIGSNRQFSGSIATNGERRLYVGEVDEVRVFEFQQGAFNAQSDLLYAVPEPSVGLTLLCGLSTLTSLSRFRRASGIPRSR